MGKRFDSYVNRFMQKPQQMIIDSSGICALTLEASDASPPLTGLAQPLHFNNDSAKKKRFIHEGND